MSALTLIALLLAAVGLYGVLVTVVEQRTAEIGVRMTLGATPAKMFKLIIRYGLGLTAIGMLIGSLGALGLSRFITGMLVGVKSDDPLTLVGTAILFLALAAGACWLPARRAAAVGPAVALREG